MGKSNYSINFRMVALFGVLLFMFSACGDAIDTATKAAPTSVNTTIPTATAGEMTTPLPEISDTPAPNKAVGFDCGNVDEIPAEECEALVALFDRTNGAEWIDNDGWLDSNLPCTWSGIECIGGHVSQLNLSYNGLSGPIPPELGNLGSLTQLYLSHNELNGAVPITLNELNNLFELDLSYNQLSGAVPENLTQIDQRMLWGNQFEGTIITDGQVQSGVDFMGVHFSADPSLASSIWPELKPATPLPEVQDGPSYWLALPRHLRFTFADPNLPPTRKRMGFNLAAEGQILVFPLAELAEVNPLVQAQIETLQNLLAEREQVPSGELPLLPLTNSAQVLQAQVQYLDFDNFRGIRFISQHSQDPRPIALSQELFYTFQGISTDGAYYVAAFYPLTTAVLPDTIDIEDWDAFFANYDTYLSETTAVLNGLSTAEFTPDLALLDAVITSLKLDLDNSFS